LRNTKITWAAAKNLKGLPKLQVLCISYRDFLPADIQKMKLALPHCNIADGTDTGTPKELFAPLH
jgi:hypothetical protein